MEGIINNTQEIPLPKTETCKVLEADICAMLGHRDGDTYTCENAADQPSKATDLHVPSIDELNQLVANEIPQNLYPATATTTATTEVTHEVDKFVDPSEPPSDPQFVDYNHLAKKPAINVSATNKRKSDNHIESNIEEKKNYQMRKNIRGVINENNFDTITIAAQREESERLARVQGLKKSIKQKWTHTALEAMVESIPFDVDLDDEEDTPEILLQQPTSLDVKDNKLLEEKRKLWNRCIPNSMAEEKDDEVVTIDSSSDDDCIILSDSDDCLDDEVADDDQHNSGLHVRDVLNIPNEHGKVMVNVGHVDSEPDIFIAPQIAKIIKPHQIGGVRFLFDNIIESTKRFNNSSGFGCILAHSMGLGKTLQVVCFSDIFLRHTDSKTILCVMPINTIQNWVKEYNLWLPEESPNHEEVRPRQFSVFALNDQHKTMTARANVILRWAAEGGVLLIGYELFRVLGLKIIKKKEGRKFMENERLLDKIHMALVKPGPDLVICDEGHRIKNAHAGISIALKQIRSRRRIVLTGYPLQNNLLEYWCMVDFVRPNYLGSKTEFCNMFERPIQNGQCIDSTPEDIKLMRYRAHVLHSLLVGFVQRRSDSVLQNSLPQKLEYVILTKMTKFQRQLYEAFMNEVVRKKKVPNPLKAFAVCCKIWNHPDVLYKFLKKRESDLDLDIDEACTSQEAKKNKTFATEESPQKDNCTPDNKLPTDPFYTNPNPLVYPLKENQTTFWQDGIASVNAQPPKPDYVGLMAKSAVDANNVEKLKCSSEIVDLDTKEVQFIKSDINTNLDVRNVPTGSIAKPKTDVDVQGNNSTLKFGKTEAKAANESISYDWALSLIKDYEPGVVSSSPKMEIFFYILTESIKLGDRVLVFSQSLLTLNLIEFFLQNVNIPETDKVWKKNVTYFRLDGSTSSLEREKLVNEFNTNSDVKLFLISTRAGSLGINLTGANRVVVFDASWNPCHDTQAVHRIYRYGQRKSCFVYRIVMDNCLEKNIYDRQVKKQGMSDRVVDECNPDAHLSIRELTNLCYDKVEENQSAEFNQPLENYSDVVMRQVITNYKSILSKEPFYHESLLIDRKEKKLSQIEKKLAKRGYEIEKKASSKPHTFLPNNIIQNRDCVFNKVNAQFPSFKHKIKEPFKSPAIKLTRWIPAEVWQRQGMSSQEMMLPIDVAIPTNSTEASNIVVKAGEKVMVLNSPKGVYMQLESGKIIAIKTSAEAAQAREKLKARKIIGADTPDKKSINALGSISLKEGICKPRIERPCPESDKDDVIVISDSINDRKESSIDMSFPKHKSRIDLNPSKKEVVPPIYRNKKDVILTEPRKDKKHDTLLLPSHQVFEPKAKPETTPRANYKAEKHRNQLFANIPNNTNYEIHPSHNISSQHIPPHNLENRHHSSHNIEPQHLPPHNIENRHISSHNLENQHIPPHNIENRHHSSHAIDSQHLPPHNLDNRHISSHNIENQQHLPPHNLENRHLSSHNIENQHLPTHNVENQHLPPHSIENQHQLPPHNAESQHLPTLSNNRWENKSPDMFKPAVKISNIPAPYPSTAVSDLNVYEKNDKTQHSVNDIINVDQYSSPYPPQPCKEPEDHTFHHSMNLNSNYYNNPLPTTSSTEEHNNSLYHYNNKNEYNYSENLYENSESTHSNYHQQMSKYSYGYYQPQYLPNFSNKVYDNNAFSSVSTQYYLRRPSTYSTSSTNGVDVGLNFTEPQGWIKKHLPD